MSNAFGMFGFLKDIFGSNNRGSHEQAVAQDDGAAFRFVVADVFAMAGQAPSVTGTVEAGSVMVGDVVMKDDEGFTVEAINTFNKQLESAGTGESVGLQLGMTVTKETFPTGTVLSKA